MELSLENLPQAVHELSVKMDNLERLLLIKGSDSQPDSEVPWNIEEAAEFCDVTVSTLYLWRQQRKIPCSKRGRRLYFFKKDLVEWIKTGKKTTAAEIEAEVDTYLPARKKRGRFK